MGKANRGQSEPVEFTLLETDVDSDENGLADDWERKYFGHIGVDPNADPDRDGVKNLYEQWAGSNPTVSNVGLLAVSPSHFSFDAISTGRVSQVTLIVTNTSDFIVHGNVDTTLPFTILSDKKYALAGHGATNVVVEFAPVVEGAFSAKVNFVSDGGNATNSVDGQGFVVRYTNQVPVLEPVPDQFVNELTKLTVTNQARIRDPHAVLTYELRNPLPGMAIDTNGVFSWTPIDFQSPSTNRVTVIVTSTDPLDSMNPVLQGTSSFKVSVIEINVRPGLPVIPSRTVNISELLPVTTMTNNATGANIHATLRYLLVNPPTGAAINNSGIITWRPSGGPSTNRFKTIVTASDPFDLVNPILSATNEFSVVVLDKGTSSGPSFPLISLQSVDELKLIKVINTIIFPGFQGAVTYHLVVPRNGMSIDTNGIFSWIPAEYQSPSTNVVTVVAAGFSLSDHINPVWQATNQFIVVVKEVNLTPQLPVIPTQTVNELTLLTVTNRATGANSHATLIYKLESPRIGMAIGPSGTFSWTPADYQSPSTNVVTTIVTATDLLDTNHPVLTMTNRFTVVVKEVNLTPRLPVIPLQTVNELTLLTVTNRATGANPHATLTYALVSPRIGMAIGPSGIFSWTPADYQSPSTNVVTTIVTAMDPLDTGHPVLKSTNQFTVVVKEVNLTPQLPLVPIQTVNELTLLTVTNRATGANSHATLTYALVSPRIGMAIGPSGIFSWTPADYQSPSTNVVTTIVTATDLLDTNHPVLTATNRFTVVVKEVNLTPRLPVIPTQTVNELTLLTVTNRATGANSHATLTYALVSPRKGMAVEPSGIFSWTPADYQSPSTNVVTTIVTATDLLDTNHPVLMATNRFTVVVKEVNLKPQLPVIPLQKVNELTLLTVTNRAAGANVHAVLGYALLGAPTGVVIDGTGIITWKPGQNQGPSTNIITTVVTATDLLDLLNPVLKATNKFTVVVVDGVARSVIAGATLKIKTVTISRPGSETLVISVEGTPGRTYQLESSSDLLRGDWRTVQSSTSATSSFTMTDTNAAKDNTRFYRVVEVASPE